VILIFLIFFNFIFNISKQNSRRVNNLREIMFKQTIETLRWSLNLYKKFKLPLIHQLKTENPSFQMIWEKKKLFEIRENDRNFQPGDGLLLQEYNPLTKQYLKRDILCRIRYVLSNSKYIGKKDVVVMSLDILSRGKNHA